MITLRKYLYGPSAANGEAAEFTEALAQTCTQVLDGVQTQVLCPAHPGLKAFCEEMQAIRDRLEGASDAAVLREAGQAVVGLLGQYRAASDELSEAEGAEVQKIIAMLSQTVAVLSAGSERSVSRLRQIENDLKQTSMIGDIVAMRSRLNDTMRYVREQSAREREESARSLVEIERGVQQARESVAVARSGLPGRPEAEQSLQAAMQRASATAVAVFELERAATIRQRFGAALGDRFFSLFAKDLGDALPQPRKLFRWSPTAVLAELETVAAAGLLRGQVQNWLAGIPQERRLDVGQRLAVLSNAHRWTAIPLADVKSAAEIVRRVDQFLRCCP